MKYSQYSKKVPSRTRDLSSMKDISMFVLYFGLIVKIL